jgi:hypothetical protein
MTTTYQTADNKLVPRLVKHVNTKGGNFKGVCVSACLGYFNIHPDQYKFTWSKRTGNNHHAILRRFGWSVRSRKSSLLKGTRTVGSVRKEIASYTDYTEDTMYLIHVMGHVLLLNSNGQTVVDTSPRKVDRRKVYNVVAIFKDKP